MYGRFDNIKIAGIGTTLPEHEIHNLSFSDKFGEKAVKKQIKVTGITKRRVVKEGQTALDLMITSAKNVLDHTRWSGEDVDVLVLASGYTNYRIPATAYIAQKLLGIKKECLVLDINLACTGTVDGMVTVASLLRQFGEGAKGLLLTGETPTIGGGGEDKATSMLSGDCGAAVAMEVRENHRIQFTQGSDGSRYEVLVRQDEMDSIHMEGMRVFEFAITEVVETIHKHFEHYGLDKEEIDYFVIHQAQKFIVDKVVAFSHIPELKVLNSYQYYGNSGGASDICSICTNIEEIKEKTPEKFTCFMTGFGAGLSWGMTDFCMNTEDVLPTVHSDKHYEI